MPYERPLKTSFRCIDCDKVFDAKKSILGIWTEKRVREPSKKLRVGLCQPCTKETLESREEAIQPDDPYNEVGQSVFLSPRPWHGKEGDW